MITTLLKHVQDLLYEYKVKGPAILTNCESVPAFRHLVQHLSKITLEHVGINRDNLKDYFRKDTTTYFNILEEQEFCVGVFCLSKGSSLKLHDHPGMLVVSKFLTGTIHHRSLDLVDKSYQVELPQLLMDDDDTVDVIGKKLEAVVRGEKTLEAGEINYLTPDRANIHKYTAMEDTAILDILLPNYNETDHYCNYYLEMPIEDNDGETSTWTTETELDKAHDKGRQHFMECENDMNKKREFVFEGLFPEFKGHKLREAGERTTLIYSFPPLDEPISLVPYNGERFEYPGVKWE